MGRRKNTAAVPGGSADPANNGVEARPAATPATPAASPAKPPRAASPRKSPKGGAANRNKEGASGAGGAVEKMDPVTLNLILREELKVAPDDVVTKENIINAVEMTKRPINKRAVYRDLETILAHEIHLGYLVKHQAEGNSYLMASINKHKHYRGTIPLKSSKRKPKPTQKILEMEAAGMQKPKAEKYSDYVTFDHMGNIVPSDVSGDTSPDVKTESKGWIKEEPTADIKTEVWIKEEATADIKTEINASEKGFVVEEIKSEEEMKHELIKESLINSSLMKMKSKPKSGKGKHKKHPPSRGTSVQGPILSVPTPYSSLSGKHIFSYTK